MYCEKAHPILVKVKGGFSMSGLLQIRKNE